MLFTTATEPTGAIAGVILLLPTDSVISYTWTMKAEQQFKVISVDSAATTVPKGTGVLVSMPITIPQGYEFFDIQGFYTTGSASSRAILSRMIFYNKYSGTAEWYLYNPNDTNIDWTVHAQITLRKVDYTNH